MPRVKHKQRALDAMANGRTLSPWYAINQLGNTRLSATIFDLKKAGHNIDSKIVEGKNKFGDDIRYSVYWLVD